MKKDSKHILILKNKLQLLVLFLLILKCTLT